MRRSVIYIFWVIFLAVFFSPQALLAASQKSHEYGDVVMGQSGKAGGSVAVTFRHWSHRAKFTCRLCHVDIEFAQEANETGVMEDDNRDGRYCGTCHNGKDAFSIEKCTQCHPRDSQAEKELNREAKKLFFKFKKGMPPAKYGNKIDWMKAEQEGKIAPKDFLPGVSFPDKDGMSNMRDEPRSPSLPGLPDIIFSHSKHVVWAGCGMCHPDRFALQTGKTNMNMKQIVDGEFCGRCHGTVAFPLNDCGRCHSKPVR